VRDRCLAAAKHGFALMVVTKNDGDFMDIIVLLSVQVMYSISCLILLSYCCKGHLVT